MSRNRSDTAIWILLLSPVLLVLGASFFGGCRAGEFGNLAASDVVGTFATVMPGAVIVLVLQRRELQSERRKTLLTELVASALADAERSRDAARSQLTRDTTPDVREMLLPIGDLKLSHNLYLSIAGVHVERRREIDLAYRMLRQAISFHRKSSGASNSDMLRDVGTAYTGYRRALMRQRESLC